MRLTWPKVSVVISTYNRPAMLARALESVLAQTFTDYEVIVVDDGSDTAGEVCEAFVGRFAEKGVALQAMNLAENSGYQSVPKNFGILYSRGSYIAYLDDDNEWDNEHLEVLVEDIERMGTDAVYSRWRYAGEGPGSGREFPFHEMNRASALGLQQTPAVNFVDTSSILHSKGAFVRAMGRLVWNPELRRFGDWELVARSLGLGLRWRGVDAVTFTYWWHGENLQLTRPANEGTVKFKK